MNDLIQEIIDMKKDLANLSEQVYGASKMLHQNSAHCKFLRYLQLILNGMSDKLAFQLKVSKEKSPPLNCS